MSTDIPDKLVELTTRELILSAKYLDIGEVLQIPSALMIFILQYILQEKKAKKSIKKSMRIFLKNMRDLKKETGFNYRVLPQSLYYADTEGKIYGHATYPSISIMRVNKDWKSDRHKRNVLQDGTYGKWYDWLGIVGKANGNLDNNENTQWLTKRMHQERQLMDEFLAKRDKS